MVLLPGQRVALVGVLRTGRRNISGHVDGIDFIATGHWTIEFRGRNLLVCKGIRKMTTYHIRGGRR